VIASKGADFHFAPTRTSTRNLINEGVNENKILVVGNTGIDALKYFSSGSSLNIKNENADVLITLHRRENTTNNYLVLIEILTGLAKENPNLKFLWVVHLI
jgi:UDP-N-acetylglucosamine 2-epimerase